MKMNGTATYQAWRDGKKITTRTEAAKITNKHVKINMLGYTFIWDRQGARKSLSFFYTYKLISYELDGVVTVI